LGSAKRNVSSKNLEENVKSLTDRLKMLAKAKEKAEEQAAAMKRDHARIQERLQASAESRAKSHDETRTLAVLRKSNQDMTARWQKEKSLRDQALVELDNNQKELKRLQTQIVKAQRERDNVSKKLLEKEESCAGLVKELREAKDASNAANIRARKAQMLQSRNSSSQAVNLKPRTSRSRGRHDKDKDGVNEDSQEEVDVTEVREKVLQLLTKYDPNKVEKMDAIMDRFKGRERTLLEKMVSRYEDDKEKNEEDTKRKMRNSSNSGISAAERRSLALQRHKERMSKIEKK